MPAQFYETLNKTFSVRKDKKLRVLNVAKACGEIFVIRVDALNEMNDIEMDLFFISEPKLETQDEQERNEIISRYSKYNPTYLSFDNFIKTVEEKEDYDIFIVDTVHYGQYIDYLLQNTLKKCKDIALFHDADPNENLAFEYRTADVAWCGMTYNSLYNFYLHNKDCTYLVRDSGQGYGVIEIKKEMVTDYDTSLVTDIKEFKSKPIFITHEKYFETINNHYVED